MPPVALLVCTNPARFARMRDELAAVGWRVEAGETAQENLELLRSLPVAAVFSDRTLQRASPAGFLAWTRREKPQAQFMVFGDPGDWRGPLRPDAFLSWPPLRAELPVAPGTIVPTDAELESSDVPLSGTTGLMSLEQLLEMLQVSGLDAVIRLSGGRGLVYLAGNNVQHASFQHGGAMQTGMPALSELIALPDTDFTVEPYREPRRKTINLPVLGAVSEAARLADERRRDRQLVELLMRTQPRLSAVAVGYPLAQQPDAGHGDTQQLFALAVELLERNRTVLGSSPQSLSLSSEKFSLAVHAFSETRFVAVAVQGRAGAALLRLVEKAVRSESETASAS